MTPPIGAGTAEAQHRPPGQPMSGEYHQQHQGAAAEQMAQTCPVHAAGSISGRWRTERLLLSMDRL